MTFTNSHSLWNIVTEMSQPLRALFTKRACVVTCQSTSVEMVELSNGFTG